jgi:hypothetical protein
MIFRKKHLCHAILLVSRRILLMAVCVFPLSLVAQVFVEGISDYDGEIGDKPIGMAPCNG